MDYKQYLQTNHWKITREKFKSKTWRHCYICHSKEYLQVHHKRYRVNGVSILFHEKHTDFRLLCRNCHGKIHKYKLEILLYDNKTKRRALRDMLEGG